LVKDVGGTADVPLQNYISNLSPQNPDAALYDAALDKIEKVDERLRTRRNGG
jgi:hypothetical protein